jgi:hypothetical protein
VSKLTEAYKDFAEALEDWDNADRGGDLLEDMARSAWPDFTQRRGMIPAITNGTVACIRKRPPPFGGTWSEK